MGARRAKTERLIFSTFRNRRATFRNAISFPRSQSYKYRIARPRPFRDGPYPREEWHWLPSPHRPPPTGWALQDETCTFDPAAPVTSWPSCANGMATNPLGSRPTFDIATIVVR